jgi:hypothetical protein
MSIELFVSLKQMGLQRRTILPKAALAIRTMLVGALAATL